MLDLEAQAVTKRIADISFRLQDKDDILDRRGTVFIHARIMLAAMDAAQSRVADLTEQFRANPAKAEDLCWFVLSMKEPATRRTLIECWEDQGRICGDQAHCMREICGLGRGKAP